MEASTPRMAGLPLRAASYVLRLGALARVLNAAVIEKKMKTVDFAAEGEPAPFYMPRPYEKRK